MPQRTSATIFPADPGAYDPGSYEAIARRAHPGVLEHVAALGLAESGGRPFLDAVARDLARLPGVCRAFVGVLQDSAGIRARTIARYKDGEREDDIVFEVQGTPVRHVVERNVCIVPNSLAEFPADPMLAEPGADVFLGVPLLSRNGEVIGLLALMARDPLPEPDKTLLTMLLLAGRASLELERLLGDRIADAEHDRLEQLLLLRTAELGAVLARRTRVS